MPKTWAFRFDPQGQGEKEKWFADNKPAGWLKVSVPGSYDVEFPGKKWYQGPAWYRTMFVPPATTGAERETILHLGGVVLRTKVWVNGRMAGSSVLPYTGLNFDITPFLQPGQQNLLVIETDNSILARALPDKKWSGWWNDGGLIWPVTLETRSPIYSEAKIATRMISTGVWTLTVRAMTHDGRGPVAGVLRLRVVDAKGRTIWRARRGVRLNPGENRSVFRVKLHAVESWSPGRPTLYGLRLSTEPERGASDSVQYPFGFRQIEVRGTALYLNGRRLVLRGVARHEFYPGEGMTMTPAQNARDLEDIKALGANFVRLPHYPQSSDVYSTCDKLGLLVWTEIPAWQSAAATLEDPTVWSEYAKPEITAMIRQHWNHPSVIIWSVANEIPSSEPGVAAYIQRAIHLVHRLDPTRLATFASDRREHDLSFGSVDIIAVNEYYGWYYGKNSDAGADLDLLHKKWKNKPIMVSEFGSGGIAGWKPGTVNARGQDYSLQHQVAFLESHLRQIFAAKRSSYIAGASIWVYNDFPDPGRGPGAQPAASQYVNAKGLVTEDRQHKPAYKAVQAFYLHLKHQDEAQRGR